MTDRHTVKACLSMMQIRGIGPAKLRRIIGTLEKHHVPVADAFTSDGAQVVEQAGLLPKGADWTVDESSSELVAAMEQQGIQMLMASDAFVGQPSVQRLAPPFLFIKGNADLVGRTAVGFCGSRKATPRGLQVADDIAGQLAEQNLVVVSGGAKGVDLATHTAALRSGGSTIVVLAEGLLDYRMPASLRDLCSEERVALVSEFFPNVRWLAGRAMGRNKTICLLSNALVLIEAKLKSGTFAAGEAALSLGLPLFTVEYAEELDQNAGNRTLLQQGARPLRASNSTGKANLNGLLTVIENRRQGQSNTGQLRLID